jgi:hypothetical protein
VQRTPRIRRLPERNTRQGFFEQEEFDVVDVVVEHLPIYLKTLSVLPTCLAGGGVKSLSSNGQKLIVRPESSD